MSRKGLSREGVIATAGDIADSEGLAAVTIARVAAALEVRGPSIYNHVAGLPALTRGIATAALQQLCAQLRDAAVGRSGEDALLAAARAYRDYARRHPGRYEAIQHAAASGDPEQLAAGDEIVTVLAGILRAWHLEGVETIHAIRGLRSALHGFVDLERIGGFQLDVPLDASYDRLVKSFAAGLGAAGGS